NDVQRAAVGICVATCVYWLLYHSTRIRSCLLCNFSTVPAISLRIAFSLGLAAFCIGCFWGQIDQFAPGRSAESIDHLAAFLSGCLLLFLALFGNRNELREAGVFQSGLFIPMKSIIGLQLNTTRIRYDQLSLRLKNLGLVHLRLREGTGENLHDLIRGAARLWQREVPRAARRSLVKPLCLLAVASAVFVVLKVASG
ncbi:MAG: hypothetical protein NXI32_20135, partial [bacterium]|nr:hypothetical protein [bacterium]